MVSMNIMKLIENFFIWRKKCLLGTLPHLLQVRSTDLFKSQLNCKKRRRNMEKIKNGKCWRKRITFVTGKTLKSNRLHSLLQHSKGSRNVVDWNIRQAKWICITRNQLFVVARSSDPSIYWFNIQVQLLFAHGLHPGISSHFPVFQ